MARSSEQLNADAARAFRLRARSHLCTVSRQHQLWDALWVAVQTLRCRAFDVGNVTPEEATRLRALAAYLETVQAAVDTEPSAWLDLRFGAMWHTFWFE